MANALKRPAALRSSGIPHPDEFRDCTKVKRTEPARPRHVSDLPVGRAVAHYVSTVHVGFIPHHVLETRLHAQKNISAAAQRDNPSPDVYLDAHMLNALCISLLHGFSKIPVYCALFILK